MKEQIDGYKSGQANSSPFTEGQSAKFQEEGCNLQFHGDHSETRR